MKYIILTIILITFSFGLLFSQKTELNEFKHNILGFKINYPKTWFLNSADEYYANLDKVKFNDNEFDEMIKKNASIPFIFLSKFKEPYDDINPSIKINTKPYGNLKGKTLTEIINLILPQFEKMFLNFKIQDSITEIKINEINATYVKFYYTLKTQEGKEFLTSSELYLIDKVNYFYMIGVGTKQDESNCKRQETLDILNTIEF